MSTLFEKELHVAIDAVAEAATLCRSVQSQITTEVLDKKDRSPVTVADFGSQALVCRAIRAAFPDDPIIAEEDAAMLRDPDQSAIAGRVREHVHAVRRTSLSETLDWIDIGGASEYSSRFWTLDPIDGTKGFLRGEQYAVALALIIDGKPTVAALGCPNFDGGAIFTAIAGNGSERRSPNGADARSIHVTSNVRGSDARFCESVESGHSSHSEAASVAETLGITKEPLRMDSQCKYAAVAMGQADIYMRLPTRADYVERIWDHAAGALVVTEAGGKVTDVSGEPLDFTHGAGLESNKGVLASNGLLHKQLVGAIQSVSTDA